MTVVCGIYGYQITRPIDLPDMRIEPRTRDYQQAKEWARDLESYQLTGVVRGAFMSEDRLFNLEAVLCFIEHLDVLITSPVEQTNDDPFAQFAPIIKTHRRNNGGGAVVGDDNLFETSRGSFIEKALARLEDPVFCEQSQFKAVFFKCVETFRQRKPFVEISYFLLFSGLESFARAIVNDRRTSNPSVPICKLLRAYGFDVRIERPDDLPRAISTYTRLRNALFHNSNFTAEVKLHGQAVELKLFDYLFHFSHLVSLVVLKAVDFDDGHINWNSWVDRQPFK